jgi:hypothetical protein
MFIMQFINHILNASLTINTFMPLYTYEQLPVSISNWFLQDLKISTGFVSNDTVLSSSTCERRYHILSYWVFPSNYVVSDAMLEEFKYRYRLICKSSSLFCVLVWHYKPFRVKVYISIFFHTSLTLHWRKSKINFQLYVNNSEDLGIDGRIILEWISGKYSGKLWTGFILLRIGTSGRLLWAQ